MRHRHLRTRQWTLMAIESLLERGRLADWREFARSLSTSKRLAADTLRVCEYTEDRRSAALAKVLVFSCYPELAGHPAGGEEEEQEEQESPHDVLGS